MSIFDRPEQTVNQNLENANGLDLLSICVMSKGAQENSAKIELASVSTSPANPTPGEISREVRNGIPSIVLYVGQQPRPPLPGGASIKP